jgi:hypothetical protein
MRPSLIFLIALAGTTFFGKIALANPGYIYINFLGHAIESTFWSALFAIIIIGYIAMTTGKVLCKIFNIHIAIKNLWTRKSSTNIRKSIFKAMDAAAKHNNSKAAKILDKINYTACSAEDKNIINMINAIISYNEFNPEHAHTHLAQIK